jgi:alpha-beta hydrolase superfamily lysophospholipase
MSHLKETEHSAAMSDGTELFYRAWQPDQPTSGGVVLFHRGHEHSGRLRDVVEALDLERISAFAWDARGHGRSPGTRGYAPSFSRMVRDVDDFMRHICQAHGQSIEDLVVLAHSVGAVSVTTWGRPALDHASPHPRGNGRSRAALWLPEAGHGNRRLRNLHGFAGPAGGMR